MKIQELLEILQKAVAEGKGDYEVVTEGCDCCGDVATVQFEDAPPKGFDKHILLERSR